MRILYAGTLPPHPGGSAISGAVLVEGFVAAGHEVRALAPITPAALPGGAVYAASHPGIRISRFSVPYFETAPDIPPEQEYRDQEGAALKPVLAGILAAERPDVILAGRETFAWHVADPAQEAGIPWVLRIAGSVTLGILRGTYPDSLAQSLLAQCRKAGLVVSPARHMAESLRQLGLERIRVIPNNLDVDRFVPQPKAAALLKKLGIASTDLVAMHASNLKPLKRPLDIVPVAEQALRREPRLLFVIVGDGPFREPMERECAARGISGRFRFAGWVDYAEMPQYINAADVMLMPCEAETQARVYLETQACGRVLIASDVPGAREVITDGETGLLFPKGNVEEMTRVLLQAAAEPARRAAIGVKARQRVQAHSWQRSVAAYLDALAEVLRRPQD
jgi:glycosyltransferase involved in cell wall biosynthesis